MEHPYKIKSFIISSSGRRCQDSSLPMGNRRRLGCVVFSTHFDIIVRTQELYRSPLYFTDPTHILPNAAVKYLGQPVGTPPTSNIIVNELRTFLRRHCLTISVSAIWSSSNRSVVISSPLMKRDSLIINTPHNAELHIFIIVGRTKDGSLPLGFLLESQLISRCLRAPLRCLARLSDLSNKEFEPQSGADR